MLYFFDYIELHFGNGALMKTWLMMGLPAVLTVALTGCFDNKKIDCSDPDGLSLIQGIVSEATEKAIKRETDEPLSSIRASVEGLGMSIADVRTAKTDPDSTKIFCEANLEVKIPAKTKQDAQASLDAMELEETVDNILENHGFEQSSTSADIYKIGISYNLQPTDDGQKVYAQLEDGSPQAGLADLLGWAVSKNKIVKEQLEIQRAAIEEEARAAKEQAEHEAQLKKEAAELAAAERAQMDAQISQAKAAYKRAVSEINEIWNSLDAETQDALREEQRAVNKEREAACQAESIANGGTQDEKEVYRLMCEVAALNGRKEYLFYNYF